MDSDVDRGRRPATPPRAGTSPSARSAFLLLLPAALLLLVIVVYPIATLFWNSLHSVDHANPQAGELFVGVDNYARAFDDDRFWAFDAAHGALHRRHGAGRRCSSGSASRCSPTSRSASSGRCASACCCRGRCRWCSRASSSAGSSSTRPASSTTGWCALGIEPLQWLSEPDARVLGDLHRDHLEGVVVHGADAARRAADDPEVAVRGGGSRRRVAPGSSSSRSRCRCCGRRSSSRSSFARSPRSRRSTSRTR